MFKRIRNMHPITGIVMGAVATLVLSGTAMAITDTSFTYSTVQKGYLMIGTADLVPESATDANDYILAPDAAYSASPDTGTCFKAPVHLPQGARMTSVRTSYRSGATSDPSLSLYRSNPVTGATVALIGLHDVVDNSNTRAFVDHVIAADLRLVSNALYAYTYKVCVGGSDYFFGARITYTYTNAGD